MKKGPVRTKMQNVQYKEEDVKGPVGGGKRYSTYKEMKVTVRKNI